MLHLRAIYLDKSMESMKKDKEEKKKDEKKKEEKKHVQIEAKLYSLWIYIGSPILILRSYTLGCEDVCNLQWK